MSAEKSAVALQPPAPQSAPEPPSSVQQSSPAPHPPLASPAQPLPPEPPPVPPSRYCRQCELTALLALQTPRRIVDEVAALPFVEGVTTPSAEYERRLISCAACSALLGGTTCAHCGAFVAYRAKTQAAVCPWPGRNKWAAPPG